MIGFVFILKIDQGLIYIKAFQEDKSCFKKILLKYWTQVKPLTIYNYGNDKRI